MTWDDVRNEFMKDNAITECSPNDLFDFLKERFPDAFSESVYVVNCSSGSWDCHQSWIGGIFKNFEDAEKLKDKLNQEAEKN